MRTSSHFRGLNRLIGSLKEKAAEKQIYKGTPTLCSRYIRNKVDYMAVHNLAERMPIEEIRFPIGTTHEGRTIEHSTAIASNFHKLLVGNSGVGKTYSIQRLIEQYVRHNTTVLILDTQGDFKEDSFGSEQDLSPSDFNTLRFDYLNGKVSINPLEISNTGTTSDYTFAYLNAREAIRLFNSNMGNQQEALLEAMLTETYERAGIYRQKQETWTNPSPSLIDLQVVCSEYMKSHLSGISTNWYERINELLNKTIKSQAIYDSGAEMAQSKVDSLEAEIKEGKEKLKSTFSEMVDATLEDLEDEPLIHFNKDRLQSLQNTIRKMINADVFTGNNLNIKRGKINVIDMSRVHPIQLPPLFHLMLYRTFQSAVITSQGRLNPKTPRMLLVFDEGKLFSSSANNPMSPLNRIFTEGRKYGLGALVGIQSPDQITKEMRSSIATTLILPIAKEHYGYAHKAWAISAPTLDSMISRQDALYCINNQPFTKIKIFQ